MVRRAGRAALAGRGSGGSHVAPLSPRDLADRARPLFTAYAEHQLVVFAAALAFRALVSLVPLVLLGLALLGAAGLEGVWREAVAPAVQERVTAPVYTAIDFSATEIFGSSSLGLIAFASLLLLWELARAVRVVMHALNRIHDVEETRTWRRLAVVDVALAVAVGVCTVLAGLAVTLLPRLGEGAASLALRGLAWLVAAALLAVAAGLLVRYAPAERPEARWASGGSLLVIATWVGATALFLWWAGSVANYKTAVGSLIVFLALTAYVLVSSAIFLVGAELDELARKRSIRT